MVVSEIDGEEQPLPILTFFGPLLTLLSSKVALYVWLAAKGEGILF